MPSTPQIDDEYFGILEQIDDGYAMLFLGAGSTANCRRPDGNHGLTGQELSEEIMTLLNNGTSPGFSVSLMQACEFYTASKLHARRGLDRFIQERLADLQPTIGHYIAASFDWRALVTTNYNRVAEDAWHEAHAAGYSAREAITIRTDADIVQHAGDTTRMRLYKPHGCITIQKQRSSRMVLTSLDYFESERIRKEMYTAVRSLAQDCTTAFIGYSLQDFTFRNIFYTLYLNLGHWANRSFTIGPISNPKYGEWLGRSMEENFKTSVLDETFDTFMLRLLCARGTARKALKDRILAAWQTIEGDNQSTLRDLKKTHIDQLVEG